MRIQEMFKLLKAKKRLTWEQIEQYYGDGSSFGLEIDYIRETKPLGSAGALYYLKDTISSENFWLIFGDVMFCSQLSDMAYEAQKKDAYVALFAHPNSHPFDSDLLRTDTDGRVIEIVSKNKERTGWYDNLVNAGIALVKRQVLDVIKEPEPADFEKDIVSKYISDGKVYAYKSSEYVKDAGTPERFKKCCEDQSKGVWESRRKSTTQKAVFLDRDGTINTYKGLISNEEEFELISGAAQAIRRINDSGYLAICVTNQPVVARGLCSIDDVRLIHRKMQTLLGTEGAYIDDIVFCPHHPDKGYPEENKSYKVDCNCRKPKTGMIDEMVEKHHIDLSESFIIGDSTIDMMLGKNAGLKTILVRTGEAGQDGRYDATPDYVVSDLSEAVELILKECD